MSAWNATPSDADAPDGEPAEFWAFISYSRADAGFAQWLHKRLEHYRVPRALRGRKTQIGDVPARLSRVFLDTAELAGATDLREELQEALDESLTLVVLCSPSAAQSPWVGKEIDYFTGREGVRRVFSVLVDGEPNASLRGEPDREAFPHAFRAKEARGTGTRSSDGKDLAEGKEHQEPLAADFRKGHRRSKAFLRLVAGILDVRFDELYRRHQRRMRRQAAAGLAALAVVAAVGNEARTVAHSGALVEDAQNASEAGEGVRLALAALEAKTSPMSLDQLRINVRKNRERARVTHSAGVVAAEAHPERGRVVTLDERGRVSLQSIPVDTTPIELLPAGSGVTVVDMSADGSGVLALSDADLYVWNSEDGSLTQTIHTGAASTAALGPSGQMVVTARDDGVVTVWDVASGDSSSTSSEHVGRVTHVEFSPDGRLIASAGEDRTAMVWDWRGHTTVSMSGHAGVVTDVSFDSRGERIVTSSRDRIARVWNARSGATISTTGEHAGRVLWAEFAPGDSTIATVSEPVKDDPGALSLWNAATGIRLGRFAGHAGEVLHVSFDRSGDLIATTGSDDAVLVWLAPHIMQNVRVAELREHRGDVSFAAFFPDPLQTLVTASFDSTVRVWNWRGGGQPTVLPTAARSVAFGATGAEVLTGSEDGIVRLWNAVSGEVVGLLHGNAQPIYSIQVGARGRWVVGGGADGTAWLWDLVQCAEARVEQPVGECAAAQTMAPGNEPLLRVALDSSGSYAATASESGTVALWNIITGEREDSLRVEGWVDALSFSPDGSRLAITGENGAWLIGTAERWEPKRLVQSGWVSHAVFSPDGSQVVTTSDDRQAVVWDAATGEQLRSLEHENRVLYADFDPRGEFLVTASAGTEKQLRIWSVPDRQDPILFSGDKTDVIWANFLPDGRSIATASLGGTVSVWGVDGELLFTLPAVPVRLTSAQLSSTGHHLAALGDDHLVRVYTLPIDAVVQAAQESLDSFRAFAGN